MLHSPTSFAQRLVPGRADVTAFLILLLILLATRAPLFGNPLIHIDEQFYLFTGDRILQGALPFVDIWDRKPVGLFLLYAGIRLLGGDGIVQYQVVAAAFALTTAWLVREFAFRISCDRRAALFSGAAYLVWLPVFKGAGGQSPVFYNLLVVAAALLCLRAIETRDRKRLFCAGSLSMLLFGIALQIKYSVVFEGIAFGLIYTHALWKARISLGQLLLSMLAWVSVALLPTAAALGAYAALGQLDAFVQANFLSILSRRSLGAARLLENLLMILLFLSPLVAAAGWALHRTRQRAPAAAQAGRLAHLWLVSATAGFFLFGTYYDHYALALLAPLSVCAAPAFALRKGSRIAALVLLLGCAAALHITLLGVRRNGTAAQYSELHRAVQPYAGKGILLISAPYPLLLMTNGAPLITRFSFPTLFTDDVDRMSIGVDPNQELLRVSKARPGVILLHIRPAGRENEDARAPILAALRQDYTLLDCVRVGDRDRPVFVLTDLGVRTSRSDRWKSIIGRDEFSSAEICASGAAQPAAALSHSASR